jgi:ribosomal protein S27E
VFLLNSSSFGAVGLLCLRAIYRLVQQHYPAFRELRSEVGRPLPSYVQEEFEAYLKCGRLEEGFLRVRCEECHAEKLVAFSCKKRGFCPSCGGRRMAETAALLTDEVLPERPLRQWVLSLPHALRFLTAAVSAAVAVGGTGTPQCSRGGSELPGWAIALAAEAAGTGRCDRRFMSGREGVVWGAQRGISGRLATWSDLLGAGYRRRISLQRPTCGRPGPHIRPVARIASLGRGGLNFLSAKHARRSTPSTMRQVKIDDGPSRHNPSWIDAGI